MHLRARKKCASSKSSRQRHGGRARARRPETARSPSSRQRPAVHRAKNAPKPSSFQGRRLRGVRPFSLLRKKRFASDTGFNRVGGVMGEMSTMCLDMGVTQEALKAHDAGG